MGDSQNAAALRSFLGFVSFYRRFLHGCGPQLAMLFESLRGAHFSFGDDQLAAFEHVKKCFAEAPVLSHPNLIEPFILDTDASAMAIGAALIQIFNGIERPVGFYSRKFSDAERRYGAYKRELLAIRDAIRHFRVYLLARPFTVRTDHRPLKSITSKSTGPVGTIARWITELGEYDFRIVYRKGSENVIADALSRSVDGPPAEKIEPEVLVREFLQEHDVPSLAAIEFADDVDRSADWARVQLTDADISRVRGFVKSGTWPTAERLLDLSNHVRALCGHRWQLVMHENLLCYSSSDEPGQPYRIIVPVGDRLDIIVRLHEPHHSGIQGTCSRISQRFWWPGLRHDVEAYIMGCEVCDRDRVANPAPKAALGKLPSGHLFACVHMDLVGGQSTLTLEPIGNRAILTMIDSFSGWAEAVALPNQKAETVVKAFYEQWVCRYGVPERIHTDQGAQFESAIFASLLDLLKIHRSRTTPYRPQANGKIERFNRTLVGWLRKAIGDHPEQWEASLPSVMMAYRSTISRSTGFTPFKLLFPREMRIDIDYGPPFPDPISSHVDFASNQIKILEKSYASSRLHLENSHVRARDLYDTGVVAHHFEPGTWVRQEIMRVAPARGIATKFQAKYSGRFCVLRTNGPLVLLHDPTDKKSFWAHHDTLRKSFWSDGPRDFSGGEEVAQPGADPAVQKLTRSEIDQAARMEKEKNLSTRDKSRNELANSIVNENHSVRPNSISIRGPSSSSHSASSSAAASTRSRIIRKPAYLSRDFLVGDEIDNYLASAHSSVLLAVPRCYARPAQFSHSVPLCSLCRTISCSCSSIPTQSNSGDLITGGTVSNMCGSAELAGLAAGSGFVSPRMTSAVDKLVEPLAAVVSAPAQPRHLEPTEPYEPADGASTQTLPASSQQIFTAGASASNNWTGAPGDASAARDGFGDVNADGTRL